MTTKLYIASENGLAIVTGSPGNWRGEIHLPGKPIRCVAVDAHPGQKVAGPAYCGTTDAGVFRSLEGISDWKACGGIRHSHVTSVAVHRTKDPQSAASVYVGTQPSMLFRSDDQGESWHELSSFLDLPSSATWSFPPRPDTHHVRFIQFDPALPSRIYMAIEAGALIRSDDAEETWSDRVPGGPYDTHTLAVHAKAPGRLYSAAGDGYYESLDGGDTWRRVEDGLEHRYCWNIAVDAGDPDTRVLTASRSAYQAHDIEAAHSFVYRRTGKEPWREVREGLSSPQGRRVPVVASSMNEPGVFYLAAEGDLFRSADGGETWQPLPIEWASEARPERCAGIAVDETG